MAMRKRWGPRSTPSRRCGPVGFAAQDPGMATRHADHPSGCDDSGAWNDTQFGRPCNGHGDGVRGSGIPNRGHSRPELHGAIVRTAEDGQEARFLIYQDVGFLGGIPDEVNVGVDEARQQGGIAKVGDLDGGWEGTGRLQRGDAPIFHEHGSILKRFLSDSVNDSRGSIGFHLSRPPP
jgi:hypothetical protein